MSDENQNYIISSLGALSLVVALGIVVYIPFSYYQFHTSSPTEKLQKYWDKDLESLQLKGKLPKQWNELKQIKIIPGTPKSKNWAKRLKPKIKINPNGRYDLEILLLSWEEGSRLGAVVQYDIMDPSNQALIWELGRTFILAGHTNEELGIHKSMDSLISFSKEKLSGEKAKKKPDSQSESGQK